MTVYGPGTPNPTVGNIVATVSVSTPKVLTRVGLGDADIQPLAPVSGVGIQIDPTMDRFILVPIVYNPTAIILAACQVFISADGITYTICDTVTFPAGTALDGIILGIKLYIPAGWYFKLITNAQASISPGVYW